MLRISNMRLTTISLRMLALWMVCNVAGAPLSGTKSIGPTGDYSSITAAIADIQTQTMGGPLVLELQAAYVSSVETFPITFGGLGTTASNTLTLRPASDATGRRIVCSSSTAAATVDLNGACYVTLDGRPGGTGTAKQLSIENTVSNQSNAGVALRFINDACNNVAQYLSIKAVNNNAGSGIVFFGTTTGTTGNDGNVIDHCEIAGAGFSFLNTCNGICSLGSTDTAARNNSGNVISNCNLIDCLNTINASAGIVIGAGSTDWTISGNSIYVTVPTFSSSSSFTGIRISNNAGNNFVVSGNYIGGRAASTGGAALSGSLTQFLGIFVSAGTATASNVQGNFIRNLSLTTSSSAVGPLGSFTGIFIGAGAINVGTSAANTIGSETGTGTIIVSSNTNSSAAVGIGSGSSGPVAISNNTIGSITASGTSTSISSSIAGIYVSAGTHAITGNLVGSTGTANSLDATASTASSLQSVTGIFSSSTGSTTIRNNVVANLNNSYAGSGDFLNPAPLRGIAATAGTNSVTDNTVRNLSTTSPGTNPDFKHSALGIGLTSPSGGQTVSRNTVHSISNSTASAAISMAGIYFESPQMTGTNLVSENVVHSLSVASSSASSAMNGIHVGSCTVTVQNNMVRVGLDAAGNSAAGASIVRGIYDNGQSTARRYFLHNSVFVGGTETSGSASTFAFSGSTPTNARTYQNNIFTNARGNGGGSGKHYAVNYGGTTVSPSGLTAGNNLVFASGSGGVFGLYNGSDQTDLAAWQAATGVDSGSLTADPLFINATGDASTIDLHVQAASPAGNAGTGAAAVGIDIDGAVRSPTTPDIGADEFGLSNNANLTALSLSSGTLAPSFATGTTSYSATLPNATGSISLTSTVADPHATVTVNGANPSTPVTLNVGSNLVTVLVTAEDGVVTKSYSVTITRQSMFQEWALTNGVSTDPNTPGTNGLANLLNFAFGVSPGGSASGALVFNGTFSSGGTAGGTGQPVVRKEGTDVRALFVRRKDFAQAGITYTVQFSGSLTSWQDSTGILSVLADDGTNQIVSVPFPPELAGRGFFRVQVSQP